MSVLTGTLSVRRYRVDGVLPADFRTAYRERLNDYAFKESPGTVGEIEGWVSVHNLLDTEFDNLNQWLYSGYAIFSLRSDKKTLPGSLFRAHLDKKYRAWAEENGMERTPKAVKTQIREELEQEWLARAFPKVAITSCVWNLDEGYLLIDSLSTTRIEAFQKRFYRTFGLRLVPWSILAKLPHSDAARVATMGPTRLFDGVSDV